MSNLNREFDPAAYLDGDTSLPETFTTGYRRDLHLARNIIRERAARVRGTIPDVSRKKM